MLELGMTLPEVEAVLDLDDALALSRSMEQNMDSEQDDNITLPQDEVSPESEQVYVL